ncbi:glycosyltransferase family 2 protein [Salinisphaera orenii]|uniref:Glycosyltransferase 2-like domain-containing protein n=1 Tax=Salinisphaera orenii YIM 95161 TaxID=1051139 RepID=A0A423Q3L3_9GAMM|nr:glycosyltransferase family A protein [Salinisphaera halophila]ROO33088.1 hypothetical protein SAHL_04065 [Salinisphaera halophila YIM 95161]
MVTGRQNGSAVDGAQHDTPGIAVIIATYNRSHLIGETLDSVLAQTRPADELIVVNDGSTDDTAAVLRRYGDRIRVITQRNGGKSSALNCAIPQSRSHNVCIFDDDDIMLANNLATHMEVLDAHPEVDFTYCLHHVFDDTTSPDAVDRTPVKTLPDVSAPRFFNWIMESPFLPTPMQGMLIRRACLERTGLFDVELTRSQDRDMVMRLARRFRPRRIPHALWALREHSGRRGPGFDSHNADERYAAWTAHKQHVFTKLRASVDIAEYVPTDIAATLVTEPRAIERYGYLQRGVIMAIHGLHQLALADLDTYLRLRDDDQRATSGAEQMLISKLTYLQAPDLALPTVYYRAVGHRCRRHPAIAPPLLRGLYWSARRDLWRRRDPHSLRMSLQRLAFLALGACHQK